MPPIKLRSTNFYRRIAHVYPLRISVRVSNEVTRHPEAISVAV